MDTSILYEKYVYFVHVEIKIRKIQKAPTGQRRTSEHGRNPVKILWNNEKNCAEAGATSAAHKEGSLVKFQSVASLFCENVFPRTSYRTRDQRRIRNI